MNLETGVLDVRQYAAQYELLRAQVTGTARDGALGRESSQQRGVGLALLLREGLPGWLSFGAWGEVFGDRVIATAILDRLLHHAVTLNIRGNSYRLKEKLKAGLVRSHEDDGSQPGGEN
jgi:hypothetical protein